MTDELDQLKAQFRAEKDIRPRPAAKAAGIEAALARYDKIFSKRSQGTARGLRLIERVRGLIRGSTKMHGLKLSHGLMAGASLAVITLVAVNSGLLREAPTQESSATPEPIEKKDVPANTMAKQAGENEVLKVGKVARTPLPETGLALNAPKLKAESDEVYGYMPEAPGGLAVTAPADERQIYYQDQGRDKFTDIQTNPVKIARDEPVSTFSIDVDTSSYSFVRGSLNQNVLPQKDAVRVEEMINYFPYDYAGPADRAVPFKANVSVFPTPWNADTRLMHIAIKGFSLNGQEKPKSNLVFLIDTSGSMDSPDKLPMLQNAMKMLVETLGPEDTVSIVTYAGSAGTVLEPTKAKDKAKIIGSLDRLMAGGSTAGAEGIRQAYQLAEQS